MTTTLPAMRGQFGSTEFFVVTMPASWLERNLRIPNELEDWKELSLEERFQREVNYKRIKDHIAPYLANDEDRFFGAFIVDIRNGNDVEFEPLSDVVKSVPKHYQKGVENFGFLILQGNEVLVPLDGQHRLAAIRFAITGKDEKGVEIPGMKSSMEIGSDTCTCIMIMHDDSMARKIFNKVNRYAKATSKADNLITADDDIVAVITREIVCPLLDARLINFKTNTLSASSIEFTTLSTLYEATGLVLESSLGTNCKIERTSLPSQEKEKKLKGIAKEFWEGFIENVDDFRAPLVDPKKSGDEKRIHFRAGCVLGRPIVQVALVEAIVRLSEPNQAGVRIPMKVIYSKVNKCNWETSNPVWQRVLLNGDSIIRGVPARNFAARFIAYYLGERLTENEWNKLSEHYAYLFDYDEDRAKRKLPPPID